MPTLRSAAAARFARVALALAAAVLPVRPAAADQITIGAAADNTMYSESGAESNGAGNTFFAGRADDATVRRALIRFDLGAIPPGSTITAVQLNLFCSRTRVGAMNVSLHRALASWGEGTSHAPGEEGAGGPAAPGDATWTHRFYDTTLWSTPGGEFAATPSATTSVGNASNNVPYVWTGASMVADVQAWVNDPAANFGWVIVAPETVRSAKRFESRESTSTQRRPSLTVTFTPPAVTGACCLPGGTCAVLSPTDCAAQGGAYQGNGAGCSPNPCAEPTGSCCFTDGSCLVLNSSACAAQGGVYGGNGTACTPNPCPQPTGACCFNNASCQVLTTAQCAAQGGTYQGDSTACTAGLCPLVLEPFVDPLAIPPIAQPTSGSIGGEAEYTIAMRAFSQQMHRDLPPTRVYGYGDFTPGPIIIARRDEPVTVTWVNDLRDPMGNLLTAHDLPVDTCLHGPDEGGSAPRTVVHLHGGAVSQEADGYPEDTFLPGQQSAPYLYPNNQPAALIWFHDHALGITRLNVYMGLAGAYVLRDAQEEALNLPSGEFEVPLVIQDRSFNPDGSLKYPAQWEEHFFGDVMIVNGRVWPYMNVKQGKYRFRLINGCNSRTLTLALSNGAAFQQITGDASLLPAPVTLSELTFTPGERADIIVDFAGLAPGTEVILTNSAPAPYPGTPGEGVVPNVVKFIVTDQSGFNNPIPSTLVPVAPLPENAAARTRDIQLRRVFDPGCNVDMWMLNGLMWDDITEYPRLGSVEIWNWINRSSVVHPMHMHLVSFQVLDRQDFDVVNGEIVPTGPRIPRPASEAGWKDTVMATPNQITRVITRFEGFPGLYPYHCHILEHEDHEMMRQFQVTCAADWNTDLAVNSTDISAFLAGWLASVQNGTLIADFNNDAAVNSTDISAFLAQWLADIDGC